MNYAQKTQYNEFVESELENWALMSWITVIMSLGDDKLKVDWIYLSKIVLDTVRGDQFLYILLEVGYKYSFDYYSISSFVLRSPSHRASLLIYTNPPFSYLPSTWMVDCLG